MRRGCWRRSCVRLFRVILFPPLSAPTVHVPAVLELPSVVFCLRLKKARPTGSGPWCGGEEWATSLSPFSLTPHRLDRARRIFFCTMVSSFMIDFFNSGIEGNQWGNLGNPGESCCCSAALLSSRCFFLGVACFAQSILQGCLTLGSSRLGQQFGAFKSFRFMY